MDAWLWKVKTRLSSDLIASWFYNFLEKRTVLQKALVGQLDQELGLLGACVSEIRNLTLLGKKRMFHKLHILKVIMWARQPWAHSSPPLALLQALRGWSHDSSSCPACHLACWTIYRAIITTSLQVVAQNLSPAGLLSQDLLEKQLRPRAEALCYVVSREVAQEARAGRLPPSLPQSASPEQLMGFARLGPGCYGDQRSPWMPSVQDQLELSWRGSIANTLRSHGDGGHCVQSC